MTVLVPFTDLHPTTARLLDWYAPNHQRIKIEPDAMSAYWGLLATYWRRPGDLVIVEQDIGITPNVMGGFRDCREPWCGHPYNVVGRALICLGCTRFTAALKRAEPDLLDVVGLVDTDGLPAKDWRRLDVRIADELEKRGYERHRHEPQVAHFHHYPQGG